MSMPFLEETWLTVQQVAERLQVTRAALYAHIHAGTFPARMVAGCWRVPLSELEEMLASPKPTASKGVQLDPKLRARIDKLVRKRPAKP
jgi:excisionase family DNA binding protein